MDVHDTGFNSRAGALDMAFAEFDGLARLDAAFVTVSTRGDPVEGFHRAVNGKVKEPVFALYRGFPDAHRVAAQERF